MDMFNAYVGVQGFDLTNGFIVKEITVLYPNERRNMHHILKPPDSYYYDFGINDQDKLTIRDTISSLHGIEYGEGDHDYDMLGSVLNKLEDHTVYTCGARAAKLLDGPFLGIDKVVNIYDMGYIMPNYLPNSDCGRVHEDYRYCSKSVATAVKNFIESRVH